MENLIIYFFLQTLLSLHSSSLQLYHIHVIMAQPNTMLDHFTLQQINVANRVMYLSKRSELEVLSFSYILCWVYYIKFRKKVVSHIY